MLLEVAVLARLAEGHDVVVVAAHERLGGLLERQAQFRQVREDAVLDFFLVPLVVERLPPDERRLGVVGLDLGFLVRPVEHRLVVFPSKGVVVLRGGPSDARGEPVADAQRRRRERHRCCSDRGSAPRPGASFGRSACL